MGTFAFCLPDITTSEWESIDGWLTKEAHYIYSTDESLSINAAFAKVVAETMVPDRKLEHFFYEKKYSVVGELINGFELMRTFDCLDEACDNAWIKECDILMSGYIEHDEKKKNYKFRVPGRLWDELGRFTENGELPVDSKIVFLTGDCIDGEWECCWPTVRWTGDCDSSILWVDKIKSVILGSDLTQRQSIKTRNEIYEREMERYKAWISKVGKV